MRTKLYVAGIVLALFAVLAVTFSPTSTLLSPLCTSSAEAPEKCLQTRSSLGDLSKPYVILGFAPYWNLKKIDPVSLTSITHFAYFHLLLNGDGTIYTKVNRRAEDPGYTNYKRLVSGTVDHGTRPLLLTFMPESQSALTSIVSSETARQKTITIILNSLVESGATGVNIDFEPLGDTAPAVRDNFTLFIKELRHSLPGLLTISIYPSAENHPRLWDLAVLAPSTDYFVVMTYDYTMPGTDNAGPNAPLRGAGQLFNNDIVKNISELTSVVPSEKILLGIPFYGYQWNTADDTKYAPTSGYGSTASLERIQQMLDARTLSLLWDRNTLTPYGVATSSAGKTSQIYFENQTSIQLKLEFVKSARLGGIALWALGYENNVSWLWPTLRTLNQ
jgi:spore germination protein YaaH